jgi:hypothetical protein
MTDTLAEIAETAARLIADEGQDFSSAKRKALKSLGLPERTALPSNMAVEAAIWEHIAIFDGDTQPEVLRALRETALEWMQRLERQVADLGESVQVLVGGGVWYGWATAQTDVWCQVFSDDPKLPEIALLNLQADFDSRETRSVLASSRGAVVETLSVRARVRRGDALGLDQIGVHFQVHPSIEMRGALLPDEAGRTPRGSPAALAERMETGFADRIEAQDV